MTCKMRRPRHRPLVSPLPPLALLDATGPIHLLCIIAGISPPSSAGARTLGGRRAQRARLSRPRHDAARHVLGYAPCRASLSLLLPCPQTACLLFLARPLAFCIRFFSLFSFFVDRGNHSVFLPSGPPLLDHPPGTEREEASITCLILPGPPVPNALTHGSRSRPAHPPQPSD